ncbi:hypothetical protein IC235_20700 [Hymenobacter sp. BT664]|uniref:Uncharacterized protein n=1 Tax=Hymenobacter montanus TaxID=2771359 RepID=A0A927BHM5_9BACT|nr:DUF6196 family protein [Hymenobacter montanus]MBD2770314.1 hypothetical protein [Hymenobacter montanus]
MYVSQETTQQIEARLLSVLRQAHLKLYSGTYCFEEYPRAEYVFNPNALAIVGDDEVWSQLVPCEDASNELFTVFSFHFTPGLDNSGFVGWLASKIKSQTGSGVFVVCGQNSAKGGIFDYWGCPIAVAEEVIKVVTSA